MNSTENISNSFNSLNSLEESIPIYIKEIERDFNEIEIDIPKEKNISEFSINKSKVINLNFTDNNMSIFFQSLKMQSLLKGDILNYKFNFIECSLCFKRIKIYGLLSNCNDVFCYNCIKEWRSEAVLKNKRELFRKCPICGIESYFLVRSNKFIFGEEKKRKIQFISNKRKNK